MNPNYKAEKARITDALQIHKLINTFASRGEMLARPLSEIYENIRDFFVIREGEQVIACAALHVCWADLAEVKSVAVARERQRKGAGDTLLDACITEAEQLGMPTLFCLTYKPAFFKRHGFSEIEKSALPHKIWAECYRCPKFHHCDENALINKLSEVPPGTPEAKLE
jgi:amino-acid N-acetyltransferase